MNNVCTRTIFPSQYAASQLFCSSHLSLSSNLGYLVPPLPPLTDLSLILALYHNSSSENTRPIQTPSTYNSHPKRFQNLAQSGDAYLLTFCTVLLPHLFGHTNFVLLGIITSHAKSNALFRQLAQAYNLDMYVGTPPSRPKHWADIWEAYIGAIILERTMWKCHDMQGDNLKEIKTFIFDIWRIRYRELMVYSTHPGTNPHLKIETLESVRGREMERATEQSPPETVPQATPQPISKSLPETNSLSTSQSASDRPQITTELIIYPTDPLLSRILFPKPNQALAEIGVIATLKVEHQNVVRGEQMEKEGETMIKAYGTSVKEATVRVKLLNSRLTMSGSKETTNVSNTNADSTPTKCTNRISTKQSNTGLSQIILINPSLSIDLGINSTFSSIFRALSVRSYSNHFAPLGTKMAIFNSTCATGTLTDFP